MLPAGLAALAVCMLRLKATAGLIAAGAATWLAFLNRQLVQASQEQVKVGQAQVETSQEQVRVSQEQVRLGQEQLVSQQRPILIPVGKPTFNPEHDNWLKWDESEQPLALRNLGTGTAFNVASVLYGCASYLHPDNTVKYMRSPSGSTHWTCWLGVPIAPGEREDGSFKIGNGTFQAGNDCIEDYSLLASDEEIPGATVPPGAVWQVARVTITYHDIAGRKYASIFDYVHNRGWHKAAVLPNIERDLHDLES